MQTSPGGSLPMTQLVRMKTTAPASTFVPALGFCSVTKSSSAEYDTFSGGGALSTYEVPMAPQRKPSFARSSCVGRYLIPIRFGTSTAFAIALPSGFPPTSRFAPPQPLSTSAAATAIRQRVAKEALIAQRYVAQLLIRHAKEDRRTLRDWATYPVRGEDGRPADRLTYGRRLGAARSKARRAALQVRRTVAYVQSRYVKGPRSLLV